MTTRRQDTHGRTAAGTIAITTPSQKKIIVEVKDSTHDLIKKAQQDNRKTIVKGHTVATTVIPAMRFDKRSILRNKRALNIIEHGKVEPFKVVSRNLQEQSASVFESYKHLVKRGD